MLARGAILIIRFYQVMISPFLRYRCRFDPTCSQYAIEAIEIHGIRRGGRLALRRIFRCHPFRFLGGKYGFDPVPQKPLYLDS